MYDTQPIVATPFTILIDSQEKNPFGFHNIRLDSGETPHRIKKLIAAGEVDQGDVSWSVRTKWKGLGAGMGDYSIEGFEGRAHIERKSLEDACNTILSFGDRKERFERELTSLADMPCSAVVIECSWSECLASVQSHGVRSVEENRKLLFRQSMAWQQDYAVPWYWCDSRAMAELVTFRLLKRYWDKDRAELKRREKLAAQAADTNNRLKTETNSNQIPF